MEEVHGKRSGLITFFIVLLILIAVSIFGLWVREWIVYFLGMLVSVEAGKSLYELFAVGSVAIISSIVVFIGALLLWNMKSSASKFLLYGPIGFLIKNVAEIIRDIINFSSLDSPTSYNITSAAYSIGSEVLQFVFWIFILIFFARQSFKSKLS